MDNFEWITEEEAAWDEPLTVSPMHSTSRRPRRRWLSLAALLALGIFVTILIYRRLEAKVDLVAQTAETAIFQTHALLHQAAVTGDDELAAQMLSQTNAVWNEQQRAVFGQGLYVDRTPLGLTAWTSITTTPLITVAPDLNTAQVQVDHPYVVGDSQETIFLRRTTHYEQEQNKWVLTPAKSIYWQGWITATGQLLFLGYPKRDEAIGDRLAPDLQQILIDLCQMAPELSCFDYERIIVRLEPDPATLAALSAPDQIRTGQMIFSLPSPSLIGLPLNEAGYQALLSGYGRYITATVYTFLTPSCCATPGAQSAHIINMWRRLGLESAAPPITFGWPEQTVFLLCNNQTDTAEAFQNGLHTYDLQADSWHTLTTGRRFVSFVAAPDDSALLLHEARGVTVLNSEAHIDSVKLWQNGSEKYIYIGTLPFLDNQGQIAPHNETLFLSWSGHRQTPQPVIGVKKSDATTPVSWGTFDLTLCDITGCQPAAVFQYDQLIWNSDDSLLLARIDNAIWVGDNPADMRFLGPGYAPFWYNTTEFGLIILPADYGVTTDKTAQLWRLNGVTGEVITITDLDLATLIPDRPFFWHQVHPISLGDNRLLISVEGVNAIDRPTLYLFLFDEAQDEFQRLFQQTIFPDYLPPTLSPDGRFIAQSYFGAEDRGWSLFVYDTLRQQSQSFSPAAGTLNMPPRLDWSADSRWLTYLEGGVLNFIEAENSYLHTVLPPIDNCRDAVWLNEAES